MVIQSKFHKLGDVSFLQYFIVSRSWSKHNIAYTFPLIFYKIAPYGVFLRFKKFEGDSVHFIHQRTETHLVDFFTVKLTFLHRFIGCNKTSHRAHSIALTHFSCPLYVADSDSYLSHSGKALFSHVVLPFLKRI